MLVERKNSSALLRYKAMLDMALLDGVVDQDEVRQLKSFARSNGITREQHVSLLHARGWTLDDWKRRKLSWQRLQSERVAGMAAAPTTKTLTRATTTKTTTKTTTTAPETL